MIKIIEADKAAQVRMLSAKEVERYKQAISSKQSLLSDLYCVADGLKVYLEQAGYAVV